MSFFIIINVINADIFRVLLLFFLFFRVVGRQPLLLLSGFLRVFVSDGIRLMLVWGSVFLDCPWIATFVFKSDYLLS